MNNYRNDINALNNLRTDLNDRLYLREGKLELVEGTHKRSLGISITPKPQELAQHLEKLINDEIRPKINSLDQYNAEEIKLLSRDIKVLIRSMDHLKYTFRKADYNSKKHEKTFTDLLNTIKDLQKKLKKKRPRQPSPSTPQHIQYTARTSLASISFKAKKNTPIADITAAAKTALSMHKERVVKRIHLLGKGILFSIPLMLTALIEPVKKLIWNPIEKKVRGQRITESPFEKLVRFVFPEEDQHKKAFEKYLFQLLTRSTIDDEVINAIIELLPSTDALTIHHIKETEIISSRPLEFESLIDPIEDGIPLHTFLEKCEKICNELPDRVTSLDSIESAYKTISREFRYRASKDEGPEEILSKNADNLSIFASSDGLGRITLENLQKLLDAVKNTPTCKKISFNQKIADFPFVKEFLNNNGFELDRKSLIQPAFIRK